MSRRQKIPASGRIAASARSMGIRIGAPVLLLLGLFLLYGGAGYQAYLASHEPPNAPHPLSDRPALAQRAVFFIIDGFHPGRAFDPTVMPTFVQLGASGTSGIVRTPPMTTTAPCIFSLATGRPGSIVQAILNFHTQETRIDSVPRAVVRAGRKLVLAGDPTWGQEFGWLTEPADRDLLMQVGVTVDDTVRKLEADAVDFLIAKLRDPAYGLLVVHLESADALGHLVTPYGQQYIDQLHVLDGLLRRVADALDPNTLLLVTGDHSMAARGTHGGEEEARLTPYVLRGPGVRRGLIANVPQTALAPTIAALLGLPPMPVTEYPPLTDLLTLDRDAAQQLRGAYFEAKLAVARQVVPGLTLGTDARLAGDAVNDRLNAILFGAADSRLRQRLAAAAIAVVGLVAALVMCWRSVPRRVDRPPLVPLIAVALAGPAAIALGATTFVALRSWLPYRSESIALLMAGVWLGALTLTGMALCRSARMRELASRWRLAWFFPVMVATGAPLVNSHWLRPQPFFEALLIAVAIAYALTRRRASTLSSERLAWMPATAIAFLSGTKLSALLPGEWVYLPALTVACLGVSMVNLRSAGARRVVVAGGLLAAAFAAAWAWRLWGGTPLAWTVVVLSLSTMAATMWLRGDALNRGTLLAGGSAALFLLLADNGSEAGVFLLAALAALLVPRTRFDLSHPLALYVAAGVAVVLRVCLYFELGDQYNFSSIRTAPGFRLVSFGLPLSMVVVLLVLKYVLPWLLILAGTLPSLLRAGRQRTRHVIDLIALAYVARFAVVAAVIDPLRILPNALDGIIGTFCITWAEFLTFVVVAIIGLNLVWSQTAPTRVVAEKMAS